MTATILDTGASARPSTRRVRALLRYAAALVVMLFGLFMALSFWAEPGSPIVSEDGALIAGGRLEETLYDPSLSGRDTRPTLSAPFRDGGRDCRRFADGGITGTACQVEGDWRVIEMKQR